MSAEDFIITRKRKKYKFARFSELSNCYEADEFTENIRNKFADNNPLVIELGAGTGYFAVEMARLHPDKRYVAMDVKSDRLYAGARKATEEKIDNIVFVRAHAMQLEDIFDNHSVNELWLTFSDPYPRKRQEKHRMTHIKFLQIYRNILKNKGILHIKTDNHNLFIWSLEQLIGGGAVITVLSFDLHNSSLDDSYKIMTTYEKRFVDEGFPIHHVDAYFL